MPERDSLEGGSLGFLTSEKLPSYQLRQFLIEFPKRNGKKEKNKNGKGTVWAP
jgi:hypothetical protein